METGRREMAGKKAQRAERERECTRRITRREKRENFAIYDVAVNHSVVNFPSDSRRRGRSRHSANFIYISFNLGKSDCRARTYSVGA